MPRPASHQKLQEWEERIRLQKESGLTAIEWCHQNSIPYHCFKYWRSRLMQIMTLRRSSFKELPESSESSGITIEYQRIQIHLSKNCDPASIAQYLRALKEKP